MRLLAISDPEFFPDEADIINSLFREGLECLHVRKPGSIAVDFRRLLSEINPEYRDRISIHQHHILAAEFSITRLHFTEKNRKSTSSQKLEILQKEGFSLSTSIHDLNEMKNLPAFFSYTFFGPVFDSISKTGYKSILPNDIYLGHEMKRIPVIGLGGIHVKNLGKVEEMNFDGAAVLGTLWKDPKNGVANFRELLDMVHCINRRITSG